MALGVARLLRAPLRVLRRSMASEAAEPSGTPPEKFQTPPGEFQTPPGEFQTPPEFQTLRVLREREHVLHVELNRPSKRNALNLTCWSKRNALNLTCWSKRNALNLTCWRELVQCFQAVSRDPSCRAVVISGAGNAFTS
ncbi:delta(3,5)-Delta(2,4)-dienoyl-CoA isomerase, mitochondrial-like, partial [Myiozetetes cayanensis]|uniref:delta(3,5)-Delta(2,4)-dienoyl-CoA isomerase, mitochondrial-like n=1 Tax=Myiozetetes cayanensis TaxID=478635 RepID=UPI0021602241